MAVIADCHCTDLEASPASRSKPHRGSNFISNLNVRNAPSTSFVPDARYDSRLGQFPSRKRLVKHVLHENHNNNSARRQQTHSTVCCVYVVVTCSCYCALPTHLSCHPRVASFVLRRNYGGHRKTEAPPPSRYRHARRLRPSQRGAS